MAILDPKQAKAAEIIAAGELKKVAAEKVGVTPQTISEWLKQPAFEAYVNGLKLAALEAARDRMQYLAGEAVRTIEALLGQEEPPATRLKAAQMVLDFTGMTDLQSGRWRWGVGSTDEKKIQQ